MRATVNLRHLEEGPQQLQGEVSPEVLEIDKLGDEIIQAKEPLRYDVEVEKQDRNLLVSGTLRTNLDCQCVRCLKAFKYPLELKPYHLYVSLEGEDAAPVVNDLVDLTPFFREDTLLAFPQHPLCSEDCAGLPNAFGSKASKSDKSAQGNETASAWSELDKLKF
ncbi:MAG TPA: YceD family protein [Verrucomicrobiae bacterium]